MADILSHSWAQSYEGKPISIARAGNVIGGGDFAVGRLIPDMVDSLFQNKELNLRNAGATRPWQHISDCLNGYILAAEHTLLTNLSNTWNFGPEEIDLRAVSEVVHEFTQNWGATTLPINFYSPNEKFYESQDLALDSSKSKSVLGWSNRFQFAESIRLTSNWYKQVLNKELTAFEACRRDIELAALSFRIF
jgi:CDP-glucose 4,6-dehydratase